LFGALVFIPLAGRLGPAALEEYTNLEMPAWILPFQVLRGMLWVALTLPVIRMMKGRWWEIGLAHRVAGGPLHRSVWGELHLRLDRRLVPASSPWSKRFGNGLRSSTKEAEL
jgi:hypothetical protein